MSAGIDDIRAHYDRLSVHYQRFWGDHIHHGYFEEAEPQAEAQIKLVRRLAEFAGIERGARVLDVGILLLGLPPFVILGGFCWLIHRRSHSYAEAPGVSARAAGEVTQRSLSVD